MMKRLFAVMIVSAAILATTASPASSQESGIAVGTRAPSAKVQTLDGKPADLGRYIGKSPVLIEFWAFWCSNCKELEPSLMTLQKKYSSKVRFVGVAVSVSQTPARVKAYTAKRGYRHDTFFDTEGKAVEAYDVPATSYVVLIDRAGKVVYTGLGGKQDLESAIRKVI